MVITISNEYGTGAVAIAHRVAERLGYELVDRQLPVVVAKRLNVPLEEVEANEDTGRSLGERLLTGLEMATPELAESSSAPPFDAEMLGAVQDAVREYASHGNVVIVGRGSAVVLGAQPGVLRVFMHAPREWRIRHVVETTSADAKTAAGEVDRIDRARAAYLRDWYAVAFGDPRLYDLCLDTSRFSVDALVEMIVSAAQARSA